MEELKELKKLMSKGRSLSVKQAEILSNIYGILEDLGVDIEAPSQAENAENIGDAINCYIDYGEYGIGEITKEIEDHLKNK
jgi:hypothetical protein